jgi:hypothetical protein
MRVRAYQAAILRRALKVGLKRRMVGALRGSVSALGFPFAPRRELRHPAFVATESDPTLPLPEPSRLPNLVWLLLLLLVAYAFSPGPVIKLLGSNPPMAIEAVYAPLIYLYDHVPAVQSFYDWYFKLWGIK